MSTKYDKQDPLWLSTKAVPGKHRKLQNTKTYAMDGSSKNLRMSLDNNMIRT